MSLETLPHPDQYDDWKSFARALIRELQPGSEPPSTSSISGFSEAVQDIIGTILTDSATIDFTYSDVANTITAIVKAASLDPSYIVGFNEAVDDEVALLIDNGTGITWTYNDLTGSLVGDVTITQYTDEMAQDAVGNNLLDTATINLTYNDSTGQISADLEVNSVGPSHLISTAVAAGSYLCTNLTVDADGRITAAASAGINDLSDVDTNSTPPTDGQALVWDTSAWVPGDVAASSTGRVPFQGARVRKAADQTAANYVSGAAVAWDTESYDTDGFHDNVTNNTRLTVPAGVTKVCVTGCIYATLSNGTSQVQLRKNGVSSGDAFANQNAAAIGGTTDGNQAETGIVDVSTGDYFELFYINSDSSVTIDSTRSWFQIEVIQSNSVASDTFAGCLLKKAADQTAANYTTPTMVTWDTETYDTLGFHDTGANTSRITIPAGVTKVRFTGQINTALVGSADVLTLDLYKNGVATYDHYTTNRVNIANTAPCIFIQSPVLNVSAGDYFELRFSVVTDNSITVVAQSSWFHCEVVCQSRPLNTAFAGAMVKKAADQTAANYSAGAAVAWDTEIYDTLGFHDNSSNTSRFTVPAGVTKVRLAGNVNASSVTANNGLQVYLYKNGTSTFDGNASNVTQQNSTTPWASFVTGVLDVSAGDYFELGLACADASITIEQEGSWFSIEAVESYVAPTTTFSGAKVRKAADLTAQNVTAGATAITWDTENWDTEGYHSTSSNTDRLTIPLGGKYVCRGQLVLNNVASASWMSVEIHRYNNASVLQEKIAWQMIEISAAGNFGLNLSGSAAFSAGDYAIMTAQVESTDTSVDIDTDSWFEIQRLE